MTIIDRIVSNSRRWLEDRLPWYDRDAEIRAERRIENHRQRAISTRINQEKQLNSWSNRLSAYRRVRVRR